MSYTVGVDIGGTATDTVVVDARGTVTVGISFGSTEIAEDDILYVRHCGGGGYGDPLDRDPELVLADVTNGLVTPAPATDVYGVVLSADGTAVDVAATEERRRALRRERLGGEEPAYADPVRADVPPTGCRIGEYLQVADGPVLQCTYCGHRIDGGNRWKDSVPRRKVPMPAAGPGRKDSPDFAMWQFFCPSCATQLDVDISYRDDPPLYDELSLLER